MKPPWWFCCGWWSPWCVLDVALHKTGIPMHWFAWVCDQHDRQILGDDDWAEVERGRNSFKEWARHNKAAR